MRSGRLGLAAPQVPEGRPRRGAWRQDRQASDRDYSRSNPTEGRAGHPTCGSLHLEVLRRGLSLVCNLFVLDLLALVEGRQTGLLYRRDMDENVLAAALRLNEPITFGRVEPLHDTGRHGTLPPFWNFDDTGTPHRIQDVARHARPSCLLAITRRFDRSELDHRPALASYSPAWIRATAAMQRFGRYPGRSGHRADTLNRSFVTRSVNSPPSIIALRKVYSITSSARASTVAGTVRPSALAALRLTVVSYLVGACAGRSVGLAPHRMRST